MHNNGIGVNVLEHPDTWRFFPKIVDFAVTESYN